MIRLAISGAMGRMGQRINALAQNNKDFKVTALLEFQKHPAIGTLQGGVTITYEPGALKAAQVLIEFTSPEATLIHLAECVKHKVKMVIGTTGLTPDQIQQIKTASKKIPIVFSSNMSVGVNILFYAAKMIAEKTAKAYSIKIVEAHHIHKKDAPSGTAKTLAQIIESASGQKISDIESIREGEIIGDHEATFESDVDVIKISHNAKTRDIFAGGSLVAAKFLATKKTGLYDMQDVLGLK